MSEIENKLPMSVVIIAKNEQQNIARCVKSVQWSNEIIVYDSGSTDQTVEIAKSLGAKVIIGEWLGFGPSKNKAVELSQNDWIFSIDADEECSPELSAEIQKRFKSFKPEIAYRIPRLSNYLRRWITHGGWYPDYQTRIFNKKYSQWDKAAIHEKVTAKSYKLFKAQLFHYVFRNIEHQVQTNNRYSSLQAEQMFKKNKKFNWLQFITKPGVKFVECYIWKLGLLDGWPGFVIAINAAHSVFMKWSKLRELEMKSKLDMENYV